MDLVVLARYMQILSPQFVESYPDGTTNIHHSFLPARTFVGADPYRRAHERGVKTIGATAHYVTEDLDAGPIIPRTSSTSPTGTRPRTWCAWPAPFAGIWRIETSSTAGRTVVFE